MTLGGRVKHIRKMNRLSNFRKYSFVTLTVEALFRSYGFFIFMQEVDIVQNGAKQIKRIEHLRRFKRYLLLHLGS